MTAPTKISALTETATLADDDEFVVVDKSDTAQAASGSTRRTLLSTLRSWLGKDEDDMASDSATHFPSQQSTKAYVDAATSQLAPLDSPTFTTDVTVPAPTAANQPIRTDGTPVSATGFTGLSATSDTGWRDVSSLLEPGYDVSTNPSASALWRRTGGIVTVSCFRVEYTGLTVTADRIFDNMTTGFTPGKFLYLGGGGVGHPSSPAGRLTVASAGAVDAISIYVDSGSLSSGQEVSFMVTYPTADAWPASLPGTAA